MRPTRETPVPVPLGLVETTAATCMARYGHWPEWYPGWAARFGGIPARVHALVVKLRNDRPWYYDPPPPNPRSVTIVFHDGSRLVTELEP